VGNRNLLRDATKTGGFLRPYCFKITRLFFNSAVDYTCKSSTIEAQVQPYDNIFITLIHNYMIVIILYKIYNYAI
jgi:hypothetical protein